VILVRTPHFICMRILGSLLMVTLFAGAGRGQQPRDDGRPDEVIVLDTGTEIVVPFNRVEVGRKVARYLPEALANAARPLNAPEPKVQRIVICEGKDDMERVLGHPVPAWACGVAKGTQGLVVLDVESLARSPLGSTRGVLIHELVHLVLHERFVNASHGLPAWLEEGVAQVLAGTIHLGEDDVLDGALLSGTLLSIQQLEEGFPSDPMGARLAYAESESFVQYLETRMGGGRLGSLLDAFQEGDVFVALDRATGESYGDLEKGWIEWLHERRSPILSFLRRMSWFGFGAVLVVLAFLRRRRRDAALRRGWESTDPPASSPESESGDPEPPDHGTGHDREETWSSHFSSPRPS
jgi:hypothetical protein